MNKTLRNTLAAAIGITGLVAQVAFAADDGVFSVTSGIDYSSKLPVL